MKSSRFGKVWLTEAVTAVEIRHFVETMTAPVLRFIDSWSGDDAYNRFGSAGICGQQWLAEQLTQHRRPAFVAVNAHGAVVGLLDHIYSGGATHVGIVVDSRLRRRSIGMSLVNAVLRSPRVAHPIVAMCDNANQAAVGLLRACRFIAVESDRYQITWRYE